MIRKFKHKITGYIATETNSEKNYKVSEPKNFTIPKWIIEDSEDWEEIKEFPKIISYRAKYIGPDVPHHFKHIRESALECHRYAYFTEDKKYRYQDDPYYTDFEIYQVAVSESEVFTLGEKIYAPGTSYKGVLNEFKVIGGNEFKIGIGIGDYANIYIDMCSIKKYKEPILVTDDNVEIFEGDEYWCIYYSTMIRGPWKLIKEKCPKFPFSIMTHTLATFKSEELAKKYLEENEPIYSKKQVREAFEATSNRSIFASKLKLYNESM